MKCKNAQRRLLASQHPDFLPATLQAHFNECPTCQEWQRRLLQIEHNVPFLPVPPSITGKGELLQKLQTAPAPRRRVTLKFLETHRRWAITAGAAAAVLLLTVTWAALHNTREPYPAATAPRQAAGDALLANLMQRNLRLAKAQTPRERIEVLADLADDLQDKSLPLAQAADGENLGALAVLYGRVIRKGLMERAQGLRDLPMEQRREVLEPLIERLARAETSTNRLAEELPQSAEPLRDIAAAAREGTGRLRALLGEDSE